MVNPAIEEFRAAMDCIIREHFPISGQNFDSDPNEAVKIVRYLSTQAPEMRRCFSEEVAKLYSGETLIKTLNNLFFSAEQRGEVLANAICLGAYGLITRIIGPERAKELEEKYADVFKRYEEEIKSRLGELTAERERLLDERRK